MTKLGNPTDIYVGSRLRAHGLAVGLSQTDLAQKAGITFQQVQKYERGANRISASRLQEFSQVLQVPASFFFEGGPNFRRGCEQFLAIDQFSISISSDARWSNSRRGIHWD